MDILELKEVIKNGEDTRHQFKQDFKNAVSLAAEMAAFSNSRGGEIYIGVSDNHERHATEQAAEVTDRQAGESETGIVREVKGQAGGVVAEQATEQEQKLLQTLKEQTMSLQELMEAMDLKHRPSFLYTYLQPSLEDGYIEMTEPGKPKSPKQKYRLTPKGIQVLKKRIKSRR